MDNARTRPAPAPSAEIPESVGREILKAVAGIQYGSVEVLIHDSRVVQIEAREKIRFNEPAQRKA